MVERLSLAGSWKVGCESCWQPYPLLHGSRSSKLKASKGLAHGIMDDGKILEKRQKDDFRGGILHQWLGLFCLLLKVLKVSKKKLIEERSHETTALLEEGYVRYTDLGWAQPLQALSA